MPSGTEVFDWTVPREWNIRDAYVKDLAGERVIDFKRSQPARARLQRPGRQARQPRRARRAPVLAPRASGLDPLPHLLLPGGWGFCVSERQREALEDAEYEVVIDSTLEDGALTYGECLLEGETADEVLISCHVCHPSLCNDNLSGIAVATGLARALGAMPGSGTRTASCSSPGRSARSPGSRATRNGPRRIRHGLVLTCVGDAGPVDLQAKPARRRRDRPGDGAGAARLGPRPRDPGLRPWGYDERQYCSPGFDLPVGCLMRTPHGRFPEYHTSADDLEFVRPEALADSFAKLPGDCSTCSSRTAPT